ncbi:putative Gag-Pol polyprotein-like 5 [Homarus americanus]|uniref:Putative Gag-Pol polyprotein-like 5 n=1 Tax=Homarus americanus TaxID=6706 RepID=A0A8J5TM26_HOMAM|nr:putative Gag-Pol polyprotein-like 5 [Homarus americanus]
MAHRAYPRTFPVLLVVLLRDQFVDALDSTHLKIQVKQSQPLTLQQALAKALEFELYVRLSLPSIRTVSSSGFKARKGQVQVTERFKGTCWYCEKIGHKQEDCYKREREKGNAEREVVGRVEKMDISRLSTHRIPRGGKKSSPLRWGN